MVFDYFYVRAEFGAPKTFFFSIFGQHEGAYCLIDKQHSVLKLILVICVNRAGQGWIR